MRRKTHEQYVKEVLEKYGPHIKVVGTYQRSTEHLEHYCTKHDYSFSRYPTLMGASGCHTCSREKGKKARISPQHFIESVAKANPTLEVVGAFVHSSHKVLVRCLIHDLEFEGRPVSLLSKGCNNCPECRRRANSDAQIKAAAERIKAPLTNRQFKTLIAEKYGDAIQVLSMFTGWDDPITYKVVKCGCTVHRKRASVLKKFKSCPLCVLKVNRAKGRPGFSKKAIRWIDEEARSRRMKNVLHALNGGEHRIPGTHYWADGYHERSKTIFEFYGDAFHGNLKRYEPNSHPHPFRPTITARELYHSTLRRERELRRLGYKVISIFESDYKARC